jgi:hypothetical protein
MMGLATVVVSSADLVTLARVVDSLVETAAVVSAVAVADLVTEGAAYDPL